MPFTVPAYAKINLGLYVVRRRDDGYHDLLTVFHHISLRDTLQFDEADDVIVTSDSPDVPSDQSNLCHKAAMLLKTQYNVDKGVRIGIEKRIPTGAGLGGGSSDAAVTLRVLNKLWGLDIPTKDLLLLALKLGSDVPFFLSSGSALAGGRGERLSEIRLSIPYHILVCNPGIHVSTPWAYQNVSLHSNRPVPDLASALDAGMRDPAVLRRILQNDFEIPVFTAHPAIRHLKNEILSLGAVFALMSGSGSSVFGLFDRDETAWHAAEALSATTALVSLTPPFWKPAPEVN